MRRGLVELAMALEASGPRIRTAPVVVGFDAFVDQVFHVVNNRASPAAFERMETIRQFAAWAYHSAGKSGLREAVLTGQVAGGCAVNQGDGLATLGFPVSAFVGMGNDPVFDGFRAKCASVKSLDIQPGRTSVYEFHDGKLMLCSFSHFSTVTADFLRDQLSTSSFRRCCGSAVAIVLTSWSAFPHMNDCWRFLQEEALAGLENRPRLFIDLADPASRSQGEIEKMLDVLTRFEAIGPVALSLNGNEARQLAEIVGIETSSDPEPLAEGLRRNVGITEIGIHEIKSATSARASGVITVGSAFTPTPRKSVGAGDRFNAGWLAGMLLELPAELQLLLGCASSGFFVRNARSGTLPELAQFVRAWAQDDLCHV